MSSAWKNLRNDLEITEIPHYTVNKKLPSDSYFTSKETANKCYKILIDEIKKEKINLLDYTFLEPSAGSGVFFDLVQYEKKIGIDLNSERNDFIKGDFLKWRPLDLTHKYITFGNPPFGVRGAYALAFINRALLFSDYVGFILPMSFHSNGKGSNMKRVLDGHLIYSKILENETFFSPEINKEIKINTLFQVWKKGEGKSVFKDYDISEYAEIYTVCSDPNRTCGLDKIPDYDFMISSSFFGNNMSIVFNFDELKYGSGYGVIIKKNKEEILEKLSNISWENYSSLATNTVRHIRKHHIEKVLYDNGFGTEK
jgi:hypothetical protein